MRVLLDTNAFLRQVGYENGKLGKHAARLLLEADGVYVSAISITELHVKTMIGKLNFPQNIQREILRVGDNPLSFDANDADTLPDFPQLTRHDPFDRMLLAQAARDGLVLLTADEILLGLGLPYVQDARL